MARSPPNTHFTWMRFFGKGMGLVAPRDFFSVVHWRVDPGTGVYSICSVSVEEGEVVSSTPSTSLYLSGGLPTKRETEGCVRGRLLIGGWVITPLPGVPLPPARAPSNPNLPPHAHPSVDSGGCHCVYLQKSDRGGSIPTWVVADVVAQQAGCVSAVGKALEKGRREREREREGGGRQLPALLNNPSLHTHTQHRTSQ